METNFKPIKYSLIKSEIKKIKHLFPCHVKYIHVFLVGDSISLSFVNEENEDITQKITNVAISRTENLTIYDYLVSQFNSISQFVNKMEANVIYIHNADFNSNVPNYLNYEMFRSLRIGINKRIPPSIKDISYRLGINQSVIYNIENRIPISYSIDTIFKFSLFFKKSIFKLFSKTHGEQMLGVFIVDLLSRNVINEQVANDIMRDFKTN